MTVDAPGSPGWTGGKEQERSYLWSFWSRWSKGAGSEWQPRAFHVALGREGRRA